MSELNFNKIKDEYKGVAPPEFNGEIDEIDEIDEIEEFENYNMDEEDDNLNEYYPEEEEEENQQEIDEEKDKNKKQNDDEQEQENGDDEDYEQEDNNGDDEDQDQDQYQDQEDILNNAKSNTLGGSPKRKEIPLITDYNKKININISSCKERITRPILTKYEKTLILGHRAQQILNNSLILVNIEKLKDKSPLEIARKELKEGLIPFIIRRPLPNGRFEDWKCSELRDIS